MARKSVDFSKSLLQFQRANRKRANQSDSQDEDTTPQSSDGSIKKVKYDNHLGDDIDVETIRLKYIMQNKSLAKTNSLMLVKMSDMESKISELISENMRLRNTRPPKDLLFRKELEDQIDQIENDIFIKFNDVLQLLKRIRATEGLAANSNLDVLSDLSRNKKKDMYQTTSNIDLSIRKENCKEINQLNHTSTFHPTLHLASSTPPPSSDLTSKSITEEPEEVEETSKERTEVERGGVNKTKEYKTQTQRNIFLDEPKLKFKTPLQFEVYQDQNVITTDNKEPELVLSKRASQTKKVGKEKTDTGNNLDYKEDKAKTEDSNYLDNNEETEARNRRRSSRNTKQVNYAVPLLRGKMRRESAKPLDAVGNDVLINYVVNHKDATVKSESPELSEVDALNKEVNAPEKDELTKRAQKSKTKRKPLANLNQTNQNIDRNLKKSNEKDPTKIQNIANNNKDDLSIFDFLEDENSTKNVYVGKRAFNRRRRRHSMLM